MLMKKNYFMLVCLMLLMAVQATAQDSAAALYGKYKFKATVEFTESGRAYQSALPSEAEVIMAEDPDPNFAAMLIGFAGSQKVQRLNEFSNNEFKVTNPNNPQLWDNYYLANAEGDNPFGCWENGTQVLESYAGVVYTYNPETKEIIVPDFTVVNFPEGYHAGSSKKANILAKYTNVKLTLIEADEIADISGEYFFKPSNHEDATMPNSKIASEFALTLAKDANGENAYNATLSIEGFEPLVLPATFDRKYLTISYNNSYIDEANGICLGDFNGYSVGSFVFELVSEGEFTLQSALSLIKANEGFLQFYMYGTLKSSAMIAPEFDWAGVYNVKIANESDLYIIDAAGFNWPTEFQFEVAYSEASKSYLVTKIFDLDIVSINYGGLLFAPAEDGKSVSINTGSIYMITAGQKYMMLYDMNNTTSPIVMTVNENGTMSIPAVCITTVEGNTQTRNAAYSNLIVTKEGMEPVEPETPETPEVPAFNWLGQYTVTAATVTSYDGKEYPSEFTMTIAEDRGVIGVTEIFGNEVVSLNTTAIPFNIAEDGKSAELSTGYFAGGKYPVYLVLYDMNAQTSPIKFTLNDDGSIKVANFCIKTLNYNTNESALAVFYQNVTISAGNTPAGIENVVVENNVVKGIFDIQGRKIDAITAPGLYIVDGKKVLVK